MAESSPALRNLTKTRTINHGHRSIMESILYPEVVAALEQMRRNGWPKQGLLIGGIALSFHVKPRTTQDIDLLFLTPADVPSEMTGFRRHRANAFEHMETGVEVEVVTPDSVGIAPELAEAVFDQASLQQGVRVASASGLVALKLQRLFAIDEADIIQLINTDRVDLSTFPLTDEKRAAFARLKERAAQERA